MNPVLLTVLPDALVMALGATAGRILPREGWAQIDRLIYYILFPALMFQAAANSSPTLHDLFTLGGGVTCIMLLGFGLGWLLRPLGPARLLDFAGVWQTAWRFNTALGLVAAQTLPEGARGLMSVAIGLAIPVANLLAVSALSRGNAMSPARTLRMIALNPLLLASGLGMVVAFAGLHLPDLANDTLTRLARAALPLALLSIGASLTFRALVRLDLFLGALNAIKLVALPAAAFGVTHALGLAAETTAVLTLFAALPTATASFVLASVFGADSRLTATLVAQSTALGCLTLPLWIALLSG
jgi:hypothetical protein